MQPIPFDAPDWLKTRGGELRGLSDGLSFAVVLDGKPLYLLKPIPADGKHACEVVQTNNGYRIKSPSIHSSTEEALCAGLEELRKSLGW